MFSRRLGLAADESGFDLSSKRLAQALGLPQVEVELALESLESQSPAEKVIGSETFAIDSDQIDEFRKLADLFFDQALALANMPYGEPAALIDNLENHVRSSLCRR